MPSESWHDPAGGNPTAPRGGQSVLGDGSPAGVHRRATLPFSVLIGSLTAVGLFSVAMAPLLDPDIFWHLLAGDEILDKRSLSGVGSDWALVAPEGEWTTSQWLAESFFAVGFRLGGWSALAVYTVVSTAVAIWLAHRQTLRVAPVLVAAVPYLIGMATVCAAANVRAQQVTFIGAAALGGVLLRGLTDSGFPRWWVITAATFVWANIHGGWVLAPVVLGLLAVSSAIRSGLLVRPTLRYAALTGATVVAGMCTPTGIRSVALVADYSSAGATLNEWQRVQIATPFGLALVVVACMYVVGWLRSPAEKGEYLVVGVLLAFGTLAWRNVTPAVLLLIPLAAWRLQRAFPSSLDKVEPRWSKPIGAVIAGLGLVWALVAATQNSDPARPGIPTTLAGALSSLPGARLLNDYNLGGVALFYGGESTRVSIDGRAEYYGPIWIDRHSDLIALRRGFNSTLNSLNPNAALLRSDSPMAWYVSEEMGWREVGIEGDYILLVPPESPVRVDS